VVQTVTSQAKSRTGNKADKLHNHCVTIPCTVLTA